jgi:hypothetical protein
MEDKTKAYEWPKELRQIVAEGTAEGLGVGISLFAQQNRISVRPTSKSKNPIDDLSLLVTAEYARHQPGYPFGDQSLKAEINAVIKEYQPAIEMLWLEKDLPQCKKLVITITCGQLLEFLTPKKAKFEETLERIRLEGLPNTADLSGPPNG